MSIIERSGLVVACLFGFIILAVPLAVSGQSTAVTTHHFDARRTGWNADEKTLSAAHFPANFGVLAQVALDDQVDAQPLLAPNRFIAGGVHDVLYVVTENNSVYAIDAKSGAILMQRNLGASVPKPLACGNNGPNVGINGTPVIDLVRQEIFVMSYVNASAPAYYLHALDLDTLADRLAPALVTASQTLTDGSSFAFDATYQRQRPALLEHDGRIYAGFGSFCDFHANQSRGWVLGWHADDLTPVRHAELNDTQATSPTSFFLSSVWMSGAGIAAAGDRIFFSTGNSDCNFYLSPEACPSESTYDGVTNIQESVIEMNPSLATREAVFTPSNVFQMDVDDADLGAAGVLLLPMQPGGVNLAAIVSKDGRLWLLDQDNLSSYVAEYQLSSGCWCAPSFFNGSDGVGRVVTSVGNELETWRVVTSPTPQLVSEGVGYVQNSEQDPGFFTMISSNHERNGSAIIWAVARPSTTTGLTLYAFTAEPVNGSLVQLYSASAGQWPNLGGNANIVPMVANGLVYVASYETLMIFGPGQSSSSASAKEMRVAPSASAASQVTGILKSISSTRLTMQTRTGRIIEVDASTAVRAQQVALLLVGVPYTVMGAETNGTFDASSITRAKAGRGAWPVDR